MATISQRDFGEFRIRWVGQINADPEMAGAGFQILFNMLPINFNEECGAWETFASDSKIAKNAHTHERTVRRIKSVAKENGHIEIISRPGKSDLIRLVLKDATPDILSGVLQCAPSGGQFHAAVLTVCRAW
jgi:hypothetical protein